ncbi:thioredoxin domain-containing protein 16-like isoform X2 [Eriocheir sinensis]|uniref:thioredoxin domain-containing protein 16-like isoform X2 n=1 Tax=Eriocheir sinensis TaxID=95602 RepID=UPI0021C946F1|nr:thioredoxin domain-containing protein 16-like isoform X2 [Eriocheir sinensis]
MSMRKEMKLLLLLSTLVLGCAAATDNSTPGNERQGSFIKETLTCSSSSEEEGFCERPQHEEEKLRRLAQDGAVASMSTKSTKEVDSTADSLSTAGKSSTNEEEPKSPTIHISKSTNSNQPSLSEGEKHRTAMYPPKEKIPQHSERVDQSGQWSQPTGGGKEEGEKKEEDEEGEGDAVWVLRQEGDLEAFTNRGNVVIVYFYRNTLQRFLREYSRSAQDLLHYRILLATVDCGEYHVSSYCSSDKINRFAYGFRGGQEKIAFPLDTLFNSNAIVASALHLALINTVPILQTAGERRNLEKRCRGHCDLIFAYLRTLGTPEHRTFLEVAHAHQSSFVFAITTYTAGTLGLPPPHAEEEEQEKGVWVIHCQGKTISEECVVSNYRGKMMLPQLLHFIDVLQLPLWHEASKVPPSQELVTPYDDADLPWLLLLHDSSSATRVKVLAPSLAELLHGSVAIITLNMDGVTDELLAKLGLNIHTITTPALAFLQRDKSSATMLLNDYDDVLEWVKEQLMVLHQKEPQSKEEQGYLPVQEVEELQQDDELVLGMVENDSFPGVTELAGPTPFNAALKIKKMAVVAFYLTWDPVSNALLQHLSAVASLLEEHHSQASLYSINCYDWSLLCDSYGINTYPMLRLYPHGRRNVTYSNAINYYHILRAILLVERPSPVKLTSVRAVEDMLALKKDIHPAAQLISAAMVGVFPTEKDSSTFLEVCWMLEGSQLLGLHISQEAVSTYCSSEAGCVVVSKPGDIFQPWRTLEAPLLRSTAITSVLSQATLNVMDQLDPERYSAMHNGAESSDEAPTSQHLVILFLPSHTLQAATLSNAVPPWSYSSSASKKLPQDNLLITIGLLAADLSEPGFVFSWLTWNDPLAQQLGPVYGLTPEVHAVVGVAMGEGEVHIFPQGNSTRASLKAWLTALREGHSTPSVVLPKKVWEPRLPGFDFMRFMQEDQDHDAEDHLVLEMEADLTAKPHHGTAGKQKV